MSSPYTISALFGNLFFLVRHEPGASADHAAVASALRLAAESRDLLIQIESDELLIDGRSVNLESPGATMLFEQLYLHGVRSLHIPPDVQDADLLRCASVLSAFPGTYESHEQVTQALGPAGTRLQVTRSTNDFEVFSTMPWRPRGMHEPSGEEASARLDAPGLRGEVTSEYERFQEISLDPGSALESEAEVPSGGAIAKRRPPLEALVRQGRDAIEKEDWGGLLEVGLLIAEGESEAPSELTGSSYRIELKRLMTRKHLAMIARFLQGDRKQEAVSLLRRFGADSTEILMDLLTQAMSIGERRGYYSAITQMNAGSDSVIQHLGHQQWYVVRNAADLCGELQLADAVPELSTRAQHPDERVRKAIAEALGKIGTMAAMEPLRALMTDPSAAVRLKSVANLSGRNIRGMAPTLAELLKTETDPDVQREALLALGRIGTPDAISQLKEWSQPGGKVIGRKPLPVRLAAVKGLALAGPAGIDVLGLLERDDAPEVRAAATAAIRATRP